MIVTNFHMGDQQAIMSNGEILMISDMTVKILAPVLNKFSLDSPSGPCVTFLNALVNVIMHTKLNVLPDGTRSSTQEWLKLTPI